MRMAVPAPVSGEIIWVERPDFVDPLAEEKAPVKRQGHQVQGQMSCPQCGIGFGNSNALRMHQQQNHRQAMGLDDMRPVELPDGSTVPAFKVHELKQQEAATELANERSKRMELEAALEELKAQVAEAVETNATLGKELEIERAKPKKTGRPTKAEQAALEKAKS